jgi:Flp pilus assembly protein TadB
MTTKSQLGGNKRKTSEASSRPDAHLHDSKSDGTSPSRKRTLIIPISVVVVVVVVIVVVVVLVVVMLLVAAAVTIAEFAVIAMRLR